MKSTQSTTVSRFLSIDGNTIVSIYRGSGSLDSYSEPNGDQAARVAWGTYVDDTPETFSIRELGELRHVLKLIAPQEMVAAAAQASPRRFAEMVAAAFDLGPVFYVASRAMWAITDHIPDATRFCQIEVTNELLNFHILLLPKPFQHDRKRPGVYKISFSLTKFILESRVLVEKYPKHRRSGTDTP